jgi:hypothetical protein
MGYTYDTVNPRCDEALSITVAGTIGSTSWVELRTTTVCPHLGKIQGAIHTARKLRSVDIEGQFIASQLQHLVVLLILGEKIEPRAGDSTGGIEHV